MLFYYFSSKKELFRYLINKGIECFVNEYLNKIDESESDFLKKYKHISEVKLKAYIQNSHIFNFLANLYLNGYDELDNDTKSRLGELKRLGYSKLFNNIDKSVFREDIDAEQILRLISLTLSGYENEITGRLKNQKISSENLMPYWKEFDDFLELLRKIYYK